MMIKAVCLVWAENWTKRPNQLKMAQKKQLSWALNGLERLKKMGTAVEAMAEIMVQRNPAIAHFKGPTDFMPYCGNALLPYNCILKKKQKCVCIVIKSIVNDKRMQWI